MAVPDPYTVLGLAQGANKKQVKAAYRRLAMRFHPDLNKDPGAREKFQQIKSAYEIILSSYQDVQDNGLKEDLWAREIYRRERERKEQWARARRAQKRKEEEYFNQPYLHDPILVIKYLIHGLGILFGIGAIVGPVLLAVFVDPATLAGSFFFILAGFVICIFIWERRRTWFRQGKFMTTWSDLLGFLKMGTGEDTGRSCTYSSRGTANGRPFRIRLHKTTDIRFRSYGALDHEAEIRSRTREVVLPRSIRAQFFHRITTLVKLASLLSCLIILPFPSFLWRFIAGILTGGILSMLILRFVRVKSKTTYLLTPSLVLKAGAWLLSLILISHFGPGFSIRTSGYVYLVIAALLFFLDMVFDLVMGFFPFYSRLFRPLVKQGKVMDALYREGYQNYQEMPVYSVVYPFFRWLF